MIHTFTNHMSKSDINRCSHLAFMVIEFSSSVVSPSFVHTVSFLVIPLFTFTDVLSSDDALRDMLESEMTTTTDSCEGLPVWYTHFWNKNLLNLSSIMLSIKIKDIHQCEDSDHVYAIFVKPQQWPTPSESIAIYCVRELVSCVLHFFSPAQKSTYETKRKNYALLLRSKLKIAKIEDYKNWAQFL